MGLQNFFRKLFGRRPAAAPDSPPLPEADDDAGDDAAEPEGQSLYDWLRRMLEAHPDGLPNSSELLPADTDDEVDGDAHVRFAPGAQDGIATHHYGPGDAEDEITQLIRLIVAHVRDPGYKTASMVEAYAVERRIVNIVDQVMDRLPKDQIEPAALARLATYLATQATHPEPMKLGLALLGLLAGPADDPILRTLGSHDEFALYAGVAVLQRGGTALDLWHMARRVTGWGRVHLVEHLCRMPDLPSEIRDWLLVDGFQNQVMNEYLALPCAYAGGLHEALASIAMPHGKLVAIAELIDALLTREGPTPGIDAYPPAAESLESFLRHVGDASPDLRLLATVSGVRRAMNDDRDWDEETLEAGRRESIAAGCAEILDRPTTRALVEEGLKDDDTQRFGLADLVADDLGIDRWPMRWSRLQRRPTDAFALYQAGELVDARRIDAYLGVLEPHFPAAKIATGPTPAIGLGAEFELHGRLDVVLHTLRRFPGRGEPFITMGLRSPSLRNRNAATAAAGEWMSLTDTLRDALIESMRIEPDAKLRRRMANVLEGRPLEDGEPDAQTEG